MENINLLDLETIKYIQSVNDKIWYYYNIAVIIPLAIFFIGRLFCPKDFSQSTDKNPLKPNKWDRVI